MTPGLGFQRYFRATGLEPAVSLGQRPPGSHAPPQHGDRGGAGKEHGACHGQAVTCHFYGRMVLSRAQAQHKCCLTSASLPAFWQVSLHTARRVGSLFPRDLQQPPSCRVPAAARVPIGVPPPGFLCASPGEHVASINSFWLQPATHYRLCQEHLYHAGTTRIWGVPGGWLGERCFCSPHKRQGSCLPPLAARTRCCCHLTALGKTAFGDSAVFIPARGPTQRGFPWKTSIQNKERRSYSGSDSATTGSFCG